MMASSLQNIVDVSNMVNKALQELKLPDKYKIDRVDIMLTCDKKYVANIILDPSDKKSEPFINTNVF